MRERSVFWDDVDLGVGEADGIDVLAMPDCNPVMVIYSDLVPRVVLKAISVGDAILTWWIDGSQLVVGVKIYGDTVGVSPIATVANPDWRLVKVMKALPFVDLLLFNKDKKPEELDRDQDVQYFCLYNV